VATVFPDSRRAHLYYRHAVATVARCLRSWVVAEYPKHVWDTQALRVGRYGRQSGAWRLRFIDDIRKSLDWAVVETGRAVLVDVFSIAWYDARWRDTGPDGALGARAVVVEGRILTNATHRAATATTRR
jgi:hypothetical protein